MQLLKLTLLSVLSATLLVAGHYEVDASHTNVGFKVKHMMVSNVRGNFTDFAGSFEFDEKRQLLQKLDGTIQAKSINTGIEKRDNHLRSADFFDAAQYPTINFVLTKLDKDKAHGKFTMHGVTKDIVLDYELGGMVNDPMGNQRVGMAFEGSINRSDYGMKWNKLIEAGGIAVSDTVKLEIEIEGILKE